MPLKIKKMPSLFQNHPVLIGLTIRLLLLFALPLLMDDGLLLPGVRYTDIDYDVFTDAADHIAHGRSPYERHTYRYTPFLAKLLALPSSEYYGWISSNVPLLFSMRYFGKILFCVADVICGYIIVVLRRRKRTTKMLSVSSEINENNQQQRQRTTTKGKKRRWWWWKDFNIDDYLTPELKDAVWWLYNPLPINICTRGSAESLVVLLPVLATVVVADMYNNQTKTQPSSSAASSLSSSSEINNKQWKETLPIMGRACIAGIFHGIGIHTKLYPVIYTISFMANFSRQQQENETVSTKKSTTTMAATENPNDFGWQYLLSEQMESDGTSNEQSKRRRRSSMTFPWKHPKQIVVLGIFWVQRILFTMSSILFLVVSMGTVGILTYLAVHNYGREALDEGLLYHFVRVDHRHNYSMYWYWIYLARGKAAAVALTAATTATHNTSSLWGYIPLLPQIMLLGFSSLGIAPYDLSFALFCQTFAFVTFNKVITAQYFTWYLCLLPLCSNRIKWNSKRMLISFAVLVVSIVAWLLSAFSLEMLGWRSHRQVWIASLFFFMTNVNLLRSILGGYRATKRKREALSTEPGVGWACMTVKGKKYLPYIKKRQ